MINQIACKNCNSETSNKYCSNCGQRTSISKVTVSETLQDFFDAMFSVNAPLLITLKILFLNPGKLFRDFLMGKRKAYYKPVAFFVLFTVIYILILSFLDFEPMVKVFTLAQENEFSLLERASLYAAKNTNNLLFIYVFVLGFFLRMVFRNKNSLVEYIVVSFYLIAVYTIFLTITIPIALYTDIGYQFVASVLMFAFIIYALTSFFNDKRLLTILKIILVFVISTVLFWLLGFGISVLILWLKYY